MEAPREGTEVVPATELTLAHRIVAGQYQIRPYAIELGAEGTVVVKGWRTRLGSTPGGSVDEPTENTYGRGQGVFVLAGDDGGDGLVHTRPHLCETDGCSPERCRPAGAPDPFDAFAAADLEGRLGVDPDTAARVVADTYGGR